MAVLASTMRSQTKIFITIFFAILTLSNSAWSKSPVWKVSDQDNYFYLGGTVHLLSKQDYPLPTAFDTAYADSEVLVTETDMTVIQNLQFQQSMLKRLMYQDGTTLKQVLSASTFNELAAFCEDRGIPLNAVIRFKPGMAATMLTTFELKRLAITGEGVDAHYAKRARKDQLGKKFLETPEQQIDFLENMGKGKEDALILYTLKESEGLDEWFKQMILYWRNGNVSGLEELGYTPYLDEFSALIDSLLINRNHDWIDQLQGMMQSPEKELVLVGALHLVGEQGLIKLLEKQGYTLQQLD